MTMQRDGKEGNLLGRRTLQQVNARREVCRNGIVFAFLHPPLPGGVPIRRHIDEVLRFSPWHYLLLLIVRVGAIMHRAPGRGRSLLQSLDADPLRTATFPPMRF